MTANEDPAARYDAEAAGAGRPGDELEDWLSDLRTEVAADPPGWIDEDPDGEHPARPAVEHGPRPSDQDRPAEPSRVGRHRAPEE
jgi:hypothetical protein